VATRKFRRRLMNAATYYYQKPVDIRELMLRIEQLGLPLKN